MARREEIWRQLALLGARRSVSFLFFFQACHAFSLLARSRSLIFLQ